MNKDILEYDRVISQMDDINSKYSPAEPPIWGNTMDLMILSRIFGLKVVVHQAYVVEGKLPENFTDRVKKEPEKFVEIPLTSDTLYIQYQVEAFDQKEEREGVELRSIAGIQFQEGTEIHIANYKNHFVPCKPKK